MEIEDRYANKMTTRFAKCRQMCAKLTFAWYRKNDGK